MWLLVSVINIYTNKSHHIEITRCCNPPSCKLFDYATTTLSVERCYCKGIFIFPFPFVSAVFYTCLLSRVWVSGVLLLTHFIVVIS